MSKYVEYKAEAAVFKPQEYLCLCKKEIISSSYPGEYKSCSCNQCAVDQTEHYVRYIGGLLTPVTK